MWNLGFQQKNLVPLGYITAINITLQHYVLLFKQCFVGQSNSNLSTKVHQGRQLQRYSQPGEKSFHLLVNYFDQIFVRSAAKQN